MLGKNYSQLNFNYVLILLKMQKMHFHLEHLMIIRLFFSIFFFFLNKNNILDVK